MPGDFEQFAEAVPVPEQGPESDAAREVRAWCERVIELGRFEVQLRTAETESTIDVTLHGPDARRFTDRHGELLDALQVLANKALVGRRVEKEIELDTNGFKDHRESDLEERARSLADRVRRGDGEQLLPAMAPAERRIVHVALQDDPDVTTESRGEGFFKRVAVILRRDADQRES